jgi:hypothetical protein
LRFAGRQAATVGLLPPSSSEEDSSDEEDGVNRQNPRMGELPPTDSDEDAGEEGDATGNGGSKKEKKERKVHFAKPAVPDEPRRREVIDEEQMSADLERLELIKRKREEQRLKRIEEEGWDRFAPISETNKPPGTTVPRDYPGNTSE